jgi:HSP20 family molecular chaperone IbpA
MSSDKKDLFLELSQFFDFADSVPSGLKDIASSFESKVKKFLINDFPPKNIFYNAEKKEILIQLAIPGYSKEDLKITQGERLTVKGSKPTSHDDVDAFNAETSILGINDKEFTFEFPLSAGSDVKNIKLNEGILSIQLGKSEDNEIKFD